MIINIIENIFQDYDKSLIKHQIGLEIYKAYETVKNRIIASTEKINEQTQDELRLCKKYKDSEKCGNLLYIDYRSWNRVPFYSKELINKFEPLILSGVCLDYLEIKDHFNDIFSQHISDEIVIYVVKDFWCYKLIADKCDGYRDIKVLKSSKELKNYYEHIQNNIVYTIYKTTNMN